MSEPLDKAYLIRLGVTIGLGVAMVYITKYMTQILMDEMHPRSNKNKGVAQEKLNEIGINLDDLPLNKHETEICSMLVVPSSIDVGELANKHFFASLCVRHNLVSARFVREATPLTWSDIGGLEEELDTLKETVIMPILHQDIFNRSKSKLLSFPKGMLLSQNNSPLQCHSIFRCVLLQGPPGCGKTMIAKATAKESNCILLNIDISVLHDMWVGESAKFVTAIFTLADKLSKYSPVIVFIDEIDTLLSTRTSRDHENSQQIKSAFMTHWDGLISSKSSRIVVMGATNIPQSIDAAVYRRMPVRIQVGLPDQSSRLKILQVLLKDEPLDASVDMDLLAQSSKGMQGSDLKEFCSQACMVRYREIFKLGHIADDGKLNLMGKGLKLTSLSIQIETRMVKMKDNRSRNVAFSKMATETVEDTTGVDEPEEEEEEVVIKVKKLLKNPEVNRALLRDKNGVELEVQEISK
eukprot:sb/3479600/